jgi:hypothetical protein
MANTIFQPSPSVPPDAPSSPSEETSTVQPDGNAAKNPVVSSPVMDKSTKNRFHTFSLEFRMENGADGTANASLLLSEFLKGFTKMDRDGSVLLLEPSTVEENLDIDSRFPDGESSLKAFVHRYIAGLRLTSKMSMVGKITVRSRHKFSSFINNKSIREFLQGSWSGCKRTKVTLRLHSLECDTRHQVGFFYNTLTRQDLIPSLTKRIIGWFSDWKESKPFPQFQIEATTFYRNKTPGTFYRLLTSKSDAPVVEKALLKLFPVPSAEMSFMASTAWGKLPQDRKNYFHKLHLQFNVNRSSFLLRGLRDSSVEIASEVNSDERITVFQYIKKATVSIPGDAPVPLFVKVEPHLASGNVELMAATEHDDAAAQWISTALEQIALRASASSFAEIFQNPGKVRNKLETKSPESVRAFTGQRSGGRASSGQRRAPGNAANFHSLLHFDKEHKLLNGGTTKPNGKPNSKRSVRNNKNKIAFNLEAAAFGAPPVSDSPPTVASAPANVNLESPNTRTRRRSRKKKKQSVDSTIASTSSSNASAAYISTAPRLTSSTTANPVRDRSTDAESITPSVESHQSYLSAASTSVRSTAPGPTPSVTADASEIPWSVPASEASAQTSEYFKIASIEREIAKLQEQLALKHRTLAAFRTTATATLTRLESSSLSAATTQVAVTSGCFTALSPSPEPGRLSVNRPHTPPSVHDPLLSSKRLRQSNNRFAPLYDDDDDVEAQITTATQQVSQLLLVPAAPPSENVSGMRL